MALESKTTAAFVALGVSGCISASYAQWLGDTVKGLPVILLWVSHAICLFVPFKGYLDLEYRLGEVRRKHEEQLRALRSRVTD